MPVHDITMTKSYDVCIVGGGVVGLWVARCLSCSGLKIALVEQKYCGSGASGGVLGALMAHTPENWNAKKQFQFDALAELAGQIEILEEETGRQTGYKRCGRLMPIRRQNFLNRARQRSTEAEIYWRHGGKHGSKHGSEHGGKHGSKHGSETFGFDVVAAGAADATTQASTIELHATQGDASHYAGWLAPECAPLGYVHDTLAARIHPEMYIAALKASVSAAPDIALMEHWHFGHFDEERRIVHSAGGASRLIAERIVLAAGYETFPLLEPMLGRVIGGGVKGQAAVFACPEGIGKPLIYDDGVYIVPHSNGLCAVGSTTEKQWQDAARPDMTRWDFIERAKALCVPLKTADMLGRWAGVRPRCRLTDPLVGRLPGRPVWVATGGYKITFGIAHRMARYIANDICGHPCTIDIPPTFQPEHHLEIDS